MMVGSAEELLQGRLFDVYRRSQIYVTQGRPDQRLQGAKRGANAARR